MKLTVLGATGRTGDHLVALALAAGHDVTAVARHPKAITLRHERLRVLAGDVCDERSLLEPINGSDAVCSALGSRAPRHPTTLYSDSIAATIAAMTSASVRRLVTVTAIPAEPVELKTTLERTAVHPLLHVFFGGGYDDMVRMEAVLRRSDRDWTILRPPRLTNRPARGHYRTALDARLPRAGTIPRADLAAAMLAAAAEPSLINHAINIAT